MKLLQIVDFADVDSLLEEAINDVADEENESVTIVADSELTLELIEKIFAMKESFDVPLIHYCKDDYDYYYVTITSDFELYVCPVYSDSGEPLLNDASDYTYIQDTVKESLIKYCGDKWKIIFGFDKDNKFSS